MIVDTMTNGQITVHIHDDACGSASKSEPIISKLVSQSYLRRYAEAGNASGITPRGGR